MSFSPTNELEQVLTQAARNPAVRPQFYRMLLESELLLLTPPSKTEQGERTLEKNENVSIVNWSNGRNTFIPIFTSLAVLEEAVKKVGGDYDYLVLKGKDLFGILSEGPSPAVLNPSSQFGKEFPVEEMRELVSGRMFQPARREEVRMDRQVFLGQPAEYPHALVDALKEFMINRAEISVAYVAQFHDPASGNAPHLLVAVGIEGEVDPVMQSMSMIAREVSGPGKVVDFTVLKPGSGLSDYFANVEPFYQRKSDVER